MNVLCKRGPLNSVAIVTCLLAPMLMNITPAHADGFNKRFYLGGGLGITNVEPESSTDALVISENTDGGAHVGVGYDVNRFLSLEAYAATLGTAEVEFLGADAGTVDYTVFGLSALGYLLNSRSGIAMGDEDTTGLYRREGASLYGRLGVGHMRNDSDRVNYVRDYPNHVIFGAGLEYGFANGIALRTELMSMDTDAKYLNVAVLKRFGSAVSAPVAAVLPVAAAALPDIAEQAAPELAPEPAERLVFKPLQAPLVYFEFDLSKLTPESAIKLDAFARELVDNDLQLQIEGHTDWLAPEKYNMSLSVRRAEAVANHLASRGISRDRLTIIGYGETRPISNNDTEVGRALNRRSEILLK